MTTVRRALLLTVTFVLGLILSACNPPEQDGGGGDTGETTGQQTSGQQDGGQQGTTGEDSGPIRVGVNLELSGDTATFGQSARKGLEMVVNQINNDGGIDGRQIELTVLDNQGRSTDARNAANKLAHQENVHVMVGSISSSLTLDIVPIATQAKVPLITPGSTNPAVTVTKDGRVRKWIFRATFTDDFAGATLAQFVYNDLDSDRIAIFYDNSNEYSRGVYSRVKDTFEKLGGTVATTATFTPQTDDFRAKLTNLNQEDFDTLVVPGYYNQAGQILRQADEVGLTQTIVGPDGWDSNQLTNVAGEAANGNYFISHFVTGMPEDRFPRASSFVNNYRAQYGGDDPDSIAMMGYNAGLILAQALRDAEEISRQGIRDALENVSGVEGVTGTLSMDENHNISEPAVAIKLEDGKRTFHKLITREDLQVSPSPGNGSGSGSADSGGGSENGGGESGNGTSG